MSYNRYNGFISEDEVKNIPFINIPEKLSDKTFEYIRGVTRMDILSDKYYNDPNYGWLIMSANPKLGSLEFEIDDMETIRIPFPLETSLNDYKDAVDKYIKYNGI